MNKTLSFKFKIPKFIKIDNKRHKLTLRQYPIKNVLVIIN